MSLADYETGDMIDELEYRGYIVIDSDDYDEVVVQIAQWKNGGKAKD